MLGDKRWNTSWGDASLKHLAEEYQHGKDVQKQLAALERARLSANDRINLSLPCQERHIDCEFL